MLTVSEKSYQNGIMLTVSEMYNLMLTVSEKVQSFTGEDCNRVLISASVAGSKAVN